MNKTREFVRDHKKQYGLLGSNVMRNDAKYPEFERSGILLFSKENYFVWGYNGIGYNNRRSSTCMYFTDYLEQPDTGLILSLDQELVETAIQLQHQYLSFSVVNRGRLEDYAFVEACRDAGVNFDQTILTYDGQLHYSVDARVDFTILDVTAQYLIEVADMVVPWLRTRSVDVIQDIFIARAFNDTLVYPSRMHLINHNHDGTKVCGPPNWALCDSEEDTSLARYDWFSEGKTHVIPTLATWSPELMASQLNHSEIKKLIIDPGNSSENSYDIMQRMWQGVSPIQIQACGPRHVRAVPPMIAPEMPDWWDDVQAHIDSIHDKGKCNEKWFTPLHRLLDNLGVTYPIEVADKSYGTVF